MAGLDPAIQAATVVVSAHRPILGTRVKPAYDAEDGAAEYHPTLRVASLSHLRVGASTSGDSFARTSRW